MTDYNNTCADCTAKIKRRRHGPGWTDRFGAVVCRTKHGHDKDGNPVLFAADYHYVYGEEQRHFPNPKKEKGDG